MEKKTQDEVEKRGGERDDGRVSSKSRMVAGGLSGREDPPPFGRLFGEKKIERK